MFRRRRLGLRPWLDPLEERCLLSGSGFAQSAGMTPAEVAAAYGLDSLTIKTSSGSVFDNGSGETIALIELYHDPNLASDVQTFDQRFGLPDPTITVDNQAGSQTNNDWALEETLDVEWAHAIAPGANILVVEAAPANANTQEFQNLMTAVNTASRTPGVVAVSMSWGFNEFPSETSYDSSFTTPGITYIAASGDASSVDYPATSPNVLAVGGTTLNLDDSGNYSSESAWSDSGGGYSVYEPEPNYQKSVQQTGQRSTPDVAFVGDPNTGVAVYETPPLSQGSGQATNPGGWQLVGGRASARRLGRDHRHRRSRSAPHRQDQPQWEFPDVTVALLTGCEFIPLGHGNPIRQFIVQRRRRFVVGRIRAVSISRREFDQCGDGQHPDRSGDTERSFADRRPHGEHDHVAPLRDDSGSRTDPDSRSRRGDDDP